MVGPAVHGFPPEAAVFQRHVAVGAALLRQAHRAGVQVEAALPKGLPRRDVGVPVQQNVAGGQRRRGLGVVDMAVGSVHQPSAHRKHGIVCQHREFQHHLVHLGVTVAAHAEQAVLHTVEQRHDLLGRIALRQVVAGAVVEQVPQQQQPVGLFPFKRLLHLAGIEIRPVQVGRDHPFHAGFSFL